MKIDIFNTQPTFNTNFSVRKISDDKYIITNSTTGDVFEVNETANLIISDIKKSKRISEIWEHINQISSDNEFSEYDLIEFVDILFENEIISI